MRTFFRSIIFYSVASVISLIFFSLLIQFKAEKLGPQSLWKFPLNIGLTEMRHVDIHVAGYLYYKVRILCWIMTNTKNYDKRAVHIRNTWGKRCNKLLLIGSTKHDDLSNIDLQVGEGRDQLWHKTREAFTYIYKHHINEADWFLKADDDTYVIMENLRYLLYPYHPQIPIYFGCKFKIPFTFFPPYMSGGGGYVLSKEALKRLVEDGLPTFEAKSSTEDLEMGNCLHMANVTAGDSRDDDGQSRFFPDTPKGVLQPNAKEFWTWTYKYYKAEQVCKKIRRLF
uniref:Glycoprotein-N-acetylgalactosamine 3-beta-galactosyltransferase 1 n=1 Tax=Glossina brevipalpis TaxID=37001 RepID=A0A1A9X485_9MUSC